LEDFQIPNISAPDLFGPDGPGTTPDFVSDDFVRVIGHSTQGGTNRYAFSEFFQIRQGQTTHINDLTFTDTPPRKPDSLSIVVPSSTVAVGQPVQLQVFARYADGTTNEVSHREAWTSYRLSNPNLATLTMQGAIVPTAPGVLYVTAVNQAATAVIGLNITSADDRFTTVVGRVVDTNGVPVAGATVRILDLEIPPVLTSADGRFRLSDVPAALGDLRVSARLLLSAHVYTALRRLVPVPSGQSTLGDMEIRPLETANHQRSIAAGGGHTAALRSDGSLSGERLRGVQIVGACREEWCPVRHGRLKGWVNRYYLAEDVSLRR
jgi:hypothetical protein